MKDTIMKRMKEKLDFEMKDIADMIERYTKWQFVLDLLPDGLHAENIKISIGSSLWPLYFEVPLESKVALEAMIETFKAKDWYVNGDPGISSNSVTYHLKHKEHEYLYSIYISFAQERDLPEDRCFIKKIGEREVMQKQTIYELVCPEGAAEDAFGQNKDGENKDGEEEEETIDD